MPNTCGPSEGSKRFGGPGDTGAKPASRFSEVIKRQLQIAIASQGPELSACGLDHDDRRFRADTEEGSRPLSCANGAIGEDKDVKRFLAISDNQ